MQLVGRDEKWKIPYNELDKLIEAKVDPCETYTLHAWAESHGKTGDMCEEKMLNPKGTGGELVMKMIDDANNMMVVSISWLK